MDIKNQLKQTLQYHKTPNINNGEHLDPSPNHVENFKNQTSNLRVLESILWPLLQNGVSKYTPLYKNLIELILDQNGDVSDSVINPITKNESKNENFGSEKNNLTMDQIDEINDQIVTKNTEKIGEIMKIHNKILSISLELQNNLGVELRNMLNNRQYNGIRGHYSLSVLPYVPPKIPQFCHIIPDYENILEKFKKTLDKNSKFCYTDITNKTKTENPYKFGYIIHILNQ